MEVWKQRDPVVLFENKLINDGQLTYNERETMRRKVIAEVEEAVEFGKESPFPGFEDLPVTPGTEL